MKKLKLFLDLSVTIVLIVICFINPPNTILGLITGMSIVVDCWNFVNGEYDKGNDDYPLGI